MKAGEYYVGDLCYVFTDEQWSEVCDLMYRFNKQTGKEEDNEGILKLEDGTEFAIFGTLWGDGSYPNSQNSKMHCVDSGTIGCVLVNKVSTNNTLGEMKRLGCIVNFVEDFEPRSEVDRRNQRAGSNGKLYFGNTELGQFVVDTNRTQDDEDEDYDDE